MKLAAVIGMLVVAGCKGGGDGDKARVGSAAAPATGSAPAAGSAAGSAASAAKTKAPPPTKALPPTKAQRSDYAKHMRAGWAAQKAATWASAVIEFEAALVAIPHDPRAVTELGWSAMNAGDFVKAKKADDEAVASATDRKIKAAALYNLGLVQVRLGDKTAALQSFVASLQLRPNPVVEQEVGKLGAKPAADAPWCAPTQKPCDCVSIDAFGPIDPAYPPRCSESTELEPQPGFHRYTTSEMMFSWDYLLDEHNQLVAKVAGERDHGNYYGKLELEKREVRTFGTHQVLWLETTDTESATRPEMIDENTTGQVDSQDVTTALTLCVIGDDKTPTRCPLRDVPVVRKSSEQHTDEAGHDLPGKATTSESDLEVTIADDGTAMVKLIKGASDSADLVGPHKLW